MIAINMDKIAKGVGLMALILASANSRGGEIAKHVVRGNIAGIDVVLYPTDIKDVVTILGSLPAGDALSGDNIALARLAGALLDKGTLTMDKFAIAKRLDQVGAQLRFDVGAQTVTVRARTLKADLPGVLSVIADELRHPAFSVEEFEKAKIELAGDLQQKSENTDYVAEVALSRAVFPPHHPNRRASPEEWRDAIDKATLTQLKEFYRVTYGPRHVLLVLVGDLDIAKIQGEIRKNFAGWSGGVPYLQSAKAIATDANHLSAPVPGKTSVTLLVGQATGLRYRDADSLPLRVGVAILGSGFTSRLMGSVRDKEGLTYHIAANVADDTFNDGDWRINASFAPTLVDKGLASAQRELQKWWQGGVSAEELEARKTDLIGSFQVGLSTTGGVASALLQAVQRGYPLSWIDAYPKSIDALTLEQVNYAIRRYIDPQKLVIIKAGSVNGGEAAAK